ncbi:hypothetical protein COV58_02470 [Candidatus Roizmanbacteria bacterium CG11_big_fil_rev_8_21_14_0_20_36_8]|uniref:Uncharacterized protein n=2 Tax=Candidatus Roizmaniibacteriota TaxID=1752723 RepID=A0A2M6IU83_9BACT|nr:MAG: hypothetical protein COV58_02470 [Candidatus Roizmanbacteria bacterium CG11_big_fil_rev_8_21_14_0_20_36_8]PIZ66242.1 MAG: hypothetical protein COY14_00675 [Candidatus Roizmanbacteria bacterium CG_4_10_14_0_2_um_filter_36_9]
MPRKTKREKIEAKQRRMSNHSLSHQHKRERISTESIQKKAVSKTILTSQKPVSSTFVETVSSYNFKKDLIKSLSITIFLILIQVGIHSASYMGLFDITSFIDIK